MTRCFEYRPLISERWGAVSSPGSPKCHDNKRLDCARRRGTIPSETINALQISNAMCPSPTFWKHWRPAASIHSLPDPSVPSLPASVLYTYCCPPAAGRGQMFPFALDLIFVLHKLGLGLFSKCLCASSQAPLRYVWVCTCAGRCLQLFCISSDSLSAFTCSLLPTLRIHRRGAWRHFSFTLLSSICLHLASPHYLLGAMGVRVELMHSNVFVWDYAKVLLVKKTACSSVSPQDTDYISMSSRPG